MMEETKRLTVDIPESQYWDLRQIAIDERCTLRDLVVDAFDRLIMAKMNSKKPMGGQ